MTSRFVNRAGLVAALAAGFLIASTQVQLAQQPAQQPAPAAAAAAGRGGRGAVDPRVQQRTYLFTDTGEQLPYAVFVSSKVSKDKKNPLIVALHGLGGDQNTMMRANALQVAEEGGYIMVGPMGYNSGGWYGAPARYNGGGRAAGAARTERLGRSPPGSGGRTTGGATARWRNGDYRSHQTPRSQRKGRDERSRHDPQGVQRRSEPDLSDGSFDGRRRHHVSWQ